MFSKQLQKLNNLLNDAKQTTSLKVDSIGLISNNISRPKTIRKSTTQDAKQKQQRLMLQTKQQLPLQFRDILQKIFKAKCQDLMIEFNDHNWQSFVKAFLIKNKVNDKETRMNINLSDFNLGESCTEHINTLLKHNHALIKINLTKNLINPNLLIRIQKVKELVLNNCKLGNDSLDELFERLYHHSIIQRLSLSSPQIKNRNILTRYDKLIALIRKSTTLKTLQLSNIQISYKNQILENCRNTTLKNIDLSDNTNVRGISPSLQYLNLSRNSIEYPFAFPLTVCQLQILNLSFNKIPYYHFKDFLKVSYFPSITHLTLDHISLHGQLFSIQNFIQLSLHMSYLSMVDCDFTTDSYMNILNGVKNNKSLRFVDLSRNRIVSQDVAECASVFFQLCSVAHVKMRHCDIKDALGKVIFKNLHRNKNIQNIDMMNNLLGDETAKVICDQLKSTKNMTCMSLDENIIKYKDMHQIQSYLQGNAYFNLHSLDKQKQKLDTINQHCFEAMRTINQDSQALNKLHQETEELEMMYVQLSKEDNQLKKQQLKKEIHQLREEQTQIEKQIVLLEFMPEINSMISMLSTYTKKDSVLDSSQFLNVPRN